MSARPTKGEPRTAGSALDARVAESLGYRAWKEKRGDYSLCVVQKPGEPEPWKRARNETPERYTVVSCSEADVIGWFGSGFPKFSTEIAAAWLVVEALRARGVFIDVETRSEDYRALAGWEGKDGEDIWMNGTHHFAASAPLAICLAALEAVQP